MSCFGNAMGLNCDIERSLADPGSKSRKINR